MHSSYAGRFPQRQASSQSAAQKKGRQGAGYPVGPRRGRLRLGGTVSTMSEAWVALTWLVPAGQAAKASQLSSTDHT